MPLKQSLRLKQQLGLTPQLQEAIRIMQLSATELSGKIEALAESNPLLELEYKDLGAEGSKWRSTQYSNYSDSMAHTKETPDDSDEDFASENYLPERSNQSLHSVLVSQLNQYPLSTKEEIIGLLLIDAINSEGYLSSAISEIISNLDHQGLKANEKEICSVLALIQTFDPAGVAARNLAECIVLQLERNHRVDFAFSYAQKILKEDLNLFMQKNNNKLLRQTGLKQEEFEQGLALIKSCNPRPGTEYSSGDQTIVKPDVMVKRVNNHWKIELNEDFLPRVSINQSALTLLKHAKSEMDRQYQRERLQEAQWLIHSIKTRQQTLKAVAQEIIAYQLGFLEHGPIALRPLTLKTIAEALDKHESTISRIIAHKTLLTPLGLYELKYFFSSQIKSQTGQDFSSRSIKVLLRKLISEEDSRAPYSDNDLAQILEKQGIILARRTVRKYRENMGLLSSLDRRRV